MASSGRELVNITSQTPTLNSHVEKARSPIPPKPKPENDTSTNPMPDSTSLIKLKERGTTLQKSLSLSSPKSDDEKADRIGHALYLYKELCDEIMEEYNLIMATEFLEASAFQGVKGAVMLDESEKACCEEVIPIIKEAMRFVKEICQPWAPPKEFWGMFVEWEKTTVSFLCGSEERLEVLML
jgi:hypothetical protein